MPPTLDSPPPLPESVTSQMGPKPSPFAGVGEMLSGMKGGDGAGAAVASPTGALKAQIDAIKKVLDTVIGSAGPGKTFFSRAAQMLDQGLQAESQKGPGSPAGPQPDASGGAPEGKSGMAPAPSFPG